MAAEKSKILEAAQQYTIRGQIQKAIDEWKKLLTNTPNDANIFNSIGDLSLKNQPFSGAKDEGISYYLKAGEIFESSGFALKAIAVYKKILKIDPSRKEIYVHLGDLNRDRGLIGNAREDYLVAAKLYSQGGNVKEALDVYRKIADLDPSNLIVRTKIAEIFLKEGLKEEAAAEYNKVATAYIKNGKRDEAEELYRQILRLDPNDLNAMIEIGRFRLDNGHLDEAIGYGRKALELASDSPEVLTFLVDSYNRGRRYDEAEEVLNQLIESKPDQLSYRETLADILLNKGESERAGEEYLALSKEFLRNEDYNKAHVYAEKASELFPDNIEIHNILFDIFFNTANKEETIGKGLYLARHFQEAGDNERAKDYYLKILQEDPHNVEAKDGIDMVSSSSDSIIEENEEAVGEKDISGRIASAEVYVKYGLMEKAVDELLYIVNNMDADHEEAHIKLKNIYRTMGHRDKAFEECMTLLRIYDSTNEYEKIEFVLSEALEINPDDSSIMAFKNRRRSETSSVNIDDMVEEARFYAQQGMIEEAVKIYEDILKNNPLHEEAIRQLEALRTSSPDVLRPHIEIIQADEEKSEAAEDTFFDLEEALKKEVIDEPKKESIQQDELLTRSFEDIFQEFHEGVKAQLKEEDYETHYNLGIAYKEMGLFQEAIEEFKLCINDTPRFLDASYMIAMCSRELGDYYPAIEILENAVASPQFNNQRHLVIKYELGLFLEQTGKKEEALQLFNQIHDTDATYRDVSERILNLQRES